MDRHITKYFLKHLWHDKCIIKRGVTGLALILLLAAAVGCTAGEKTSPGSVEPDSIKADPMRFVSGSIHGSWVGIAAAIAGKANVYFEDYPITASTGGAISNPYLIQKGEAEIGFSQGFFLASAIAGEEPYESAMDNITGIASLETTPLYFIADRNIPGDTLGEILQGKGKIRLGSLPQSDASSQIMEYVFSEYGLSNAETVQEPGTGIYVAEGSTLFKAYQDHYFDVMAINEAISDAAIEELMNERESKLLELEPEIIAALSQKYDWIQITIPAGTYPGQTKDIKTVGIQTVLIVHKDIPEQVAYFLTKTVCENKAYFETIQDSYKAVNINDMPKHLVVPIHPGAERYYRETGLIKFREAL